MAARAQSSHQIISTRAHGIIDVGMVVLLLAAPYLLGFANGTAAQYVPMAIAVAIAGVTLLTRFEWGAMPVIPMPMHLMADIGAGVLLAASPWLFGFSDTVKWPHVIVGLLEIGAAAMTKTQPQKVGFA